MDFEIPDLGQIILDANQIRPTCVEKLKAVCESELFESETDRDRAHWRDVLRQLNYLEETLTTE